MPTRYALLALAVVLALPAAQAQGTFDPRPLEGSPAASGASFDNARLPASFFEPTTYVGAFAPGGERWDLPWANYDPQNTDYGDPAAAVVVQGDITTNTTWTANNTYLLRGFVNVTEGATLTIEPGTVVFGEPPRSSLIINRGARLVADGAPEAPIVFTSNQPTGERANGDWGGIIIAGRAGINIGTGEAVLEGGTNTTFGGGASPNDDDDSGVLRYVRVEFAGAEFQPNNEINGITMGGVGRGTVMEYVQVSYCDDDSFEWFGGTINGRYLISYAALDDDFDGDNGWRGNVQYGLIVRDPFLSDVSTSNGFEQDNAGSEPEPPQTPRSAPTFSNVTVIGPLAFMPALPEGHFFGSGIHVRRASRFSIYNSIVTGFPTGLRMDGPNVAADAQSGALQVRNTIVTGPIATNQAAFDATAWFTQEASGNRRLDGPADLLFVSIEGLPIVSNEGSSPLATFGFDLTAAYPNPVAGALHLAYEVEAAQQIQVAVYDVLGRQVALLADGPAPAGEQRLTVDTSALPSGVYVLRLQGEAGAVSRRVTVLR